MDEVTYPGPGPTDAYGPGPRGNPNPPSSGTSGSLVLRNPDHLRRWTAALGDARYGGISQPVLTCVGDSITAGTMAQNVDGAPASDTERRQLMERGYVGILRSLFDEMFGFGGEGYIFPIPPEVTATYYEHRVEEGGAPAASTLNAGPIGSGRQIDSGDSLTFTTDEACTQIDIIATWNDSVSVAFTYTVDGGASQTGPTKAGEQVYTHSITGLTDTRHTLVITAPATGRADIGGIVASRPGQGVIVNEIAQGGAHTTNMAGNGLGAQGQARMLAATFTATSTDLAIIMARYNDNKNTTIAPATFKSNLQAMVDVVVAQGGCALLVPDPAGAYSLGEEANEALYSTAMKEISDATDHVAFTDLETFWPSFTVADGLDMTMDALVHPNTRGHGVIGQALFRLLTSAHQAA